MNRRTLASLAALSLPVLAGLPSLALAGVTIQTPPTAQLDTIEELLDRICGVVNVIFTILIIVVIVFVIISAFKYLTAGGDPEKVKAANYSLIYAAIALVVALIAKGFPLIVSRFFTGTTFTGC